MDGVKKCTILPSPTQEKNIHRQEKKKKATIRELEKIQRFGMWEEIWGRAASTLAGKGGDGGSDTTVLPGPPCPKSILSRGQEVFFRTPDLFPQWAMKIWFPAKTRVRRRMKIHVMFQDEDFGHPLSSSSSALFENHHPHNI